MPKYTVTRKMEITFYYYDVEAENEEEAISKVQADYANQSLNEADDWEDISYKSSEKNHTKTWMTNSTTST